MKSKFLLIVSMFILVVGGVALYRYFFLEGPNMEKQCRFYQKGEFTFTKKSQVRIVRNDSVQTEYSLEADWMDRYYIEWISDCEYKLYLKETNRPDGLDFSKTDTMWVTIIETTPASYRYKAFKTGRTFEGSMIKLN